MARRVVTAANAQSSSRSLNRRGRTADYLTRAWLRITECGSQVVAFGPVTLLMRTLKDGAVHLVTYIIVYIFLVFCFGVMGYRCVLPLAFKRPLLN